jgi:hypothetical protein
VEISDGAIIKRCNESCVKVVSKPNLQSKTPLSHSNTCNIQNVAVICLLGDFRDVIVAYFMGIITIFARNGSGMPLKSQTTYPTALCTNEAGLFPG